MGEIKPCEENSSADRVSFSVLISNTWMHAPPSPHSSSQQRVEPAIWLMNNEWVSIPLERQVKQVGCEESPWIWSKKTDCSSISMCKFSIEQGRRHTPKHRNAFSYFIHFYFMMLLNANRMNSHWSILGQVCDHKNVDKWSNNGFIPRTCTCLKNKSQA